MKERNLIGDSCTFQIQSLFTNFNVQMALNFERLFLVGIYNYFMYKLSTRRQINNFHAEEQDTVLEVFPELTVRN